MKCYAIPYKIQRYDVILGCRIQFKMVLLDLLIRVSLVRVQQGEPRGTDFFGSSFFRYARRLSRRSAWIKRSILLAGGRLIAAPTRRTVYPGFLWPSGCFPSSGPGCARSTFPEGEGFLRRGCEKNPLLGEGGSAKPRRVWGGTNSDPVPPLFRPCGPPSPRGRFYGVVFSPGGRSRSG